MFNYQQFLGVEALAKEAEYGNGVKIAILDSGTPHVYLFGGTNQAFYSNKGNGRDNFGHSTSIASILFGCNGITGLCPLSSPLYAKVLDDNGNGDVKSIVDGIDRAIEWGADIINLSVGFTRTDICPRKLKKACQKAYDSKCTIICAAGNDGNRVNWPAALDTTICVGASDENNLSASFSSHGEVDFVAPGVNLIVHDAISGINKKVSGTSYSTAIITGLTALLIAQCHKQSSLVIGPNFIREKLVERVQDIGPKGWDENSGYGALICSTNDFTANQKLKVGFFDKILGKIRCLFRIIEKGVKNVKF